MSEGAHGRAPADPCGSVDLDPHRPDNRPALDEIAYRIGRQPEFLARMLARIARETVSDTATQEVSWPLRALSSRTTDDPSVALMDSWACTLDVLSFYQERIANEGYVHTADERVSAVELARTIGYELDPGVAASTRLAFTVEDADDPFRVVEIPEGIQVMSVPEESGERPQIFETIETIEARAEWNTIPARTERPQNLALFQARRGAADDRDGQLYLLDLDNSFDFTTIEPMDVVTIDRVVVEEFIPVTPGLDLAAALDDLEADAALNPEIEPVIRGVAVAQVQLRGIGLALQTDDRVLCVGVRPVEDGAAPVVKVVPYRILAAVEDREHFMTRLDVAPIGAAPSPRRPLQLRFHPPKLKLGTVATQPLAFDVVNVDRLVRRTTWSGAALSALVQTQAWPRVKLMRLVRQPAAMISPELGTAQPGFYVLRQSLGFFGNAAPKWETLAKPDETRGGSKDDPYPNSWEPSGAPRTVWTDSQGNPLEDAHAFLEREVKEAVPDGWILLETPAGQTASFRIAAAAAQSRSDFALSGKTTGLVLRQPDGHFTPFTNGTTVKADLQPFTFRTASAKVASELLPLAGLPILDDLEAGAAEVMLDSLYLDLEPGRAVSIAGERADAPGVAADESQIIEDVTHIGGFTRLRLEAGLEFTYRRPSVRVNANVALGTHGERVEEVLGDGDATRPNQAFALAKPPLTFVSAATETGSATTLRVRVNGIEWAEIQSLYEAGPLDEVYAVRIDDDGTTRVVFGDGERGKRLPTGSLNIAASYRSSMGVAGEVAEGTLIQLRTRPLGVRGVTNPSPATGAAAAETLDDAREHAPASVRTLGRIVSLIDYEDFARAFAGIGKARADALWHGRERIVHVTGAPATDSVFEDAAPTLVNLRGAMERLRDPARRLVVAPHARRLFQLSAKIVHDPRHLADDVEAAVRARLEADFGYEARSLSQPVSAAEVIAAIQGVAGVDHVDLDALQPYREDEPAAVPSLASVLPAFPARLGAADPPEILPAELLTVLPPAITLTLEAADG